MRKLLLVLFTPLLLTACATDGKFSIHNKFTTLDDCGDGGTYVTFKYNDSRMEINPKIKTKAGTGLEFRLATKYDRKAPVDYEKMLVTIKGKEGTEPDPSWINVSGTYEKAAPPHHSLFQCIREGTPEGTYQYLITVEKLGTLDPRARVDP